MDSASGSFARVHVYVYVCALCTEHGDALVIGEGSGFVRIQDDKIVWNYICIIIQGIYKDQNIRNNLYAMC